MKFVITAGGTGGHIYPALSVLDKIKDNEKNEYLYIGTKDRMESEIIPSKGIPYFGLRIAGLSKNIIKDIKNIKNVIASYNECKKKLKEFNPDVVIGFGGYVTLPVIYAAKKLGIKTAIHEQNIMPGKTNKFLAKYADIVFVSAEESVKYFKHKNIIVSGNPCEERALLINKKNKSDYGFDKNKNLIIVVMGSLGSSSVNEKLCNFFRNYQSEENEILFITGKRSYNDLSNNLIVPQCVRMLPYVEELPGLMKSADLIISRAGASTISEILATKIPSILVPSPYVANNHQLYNALDMQNKNISTFIEEKDLNKDILNNKINEMLNNENIKKALKDIKVKQSSTIIYNEITK